MELVYFYVQQLAWKMVICCSQIFLTVLEKSRGRKIESFSVGWKDLGETGLQKSRPCWSKKKIVNKSSFGFQFSGGSVAEEGSPSLYFSDSNVEMGKVIHRSQESRILERKQSIVETLTPILQFIETWSAGGTLPRSAVLHRSTFNFWFLISEKGENMRGKESLTFFLYCGVFLDSLQISRISDCCGVKHKTKVVQNSNSRKDSKDSCSRIYNVWKSDDHVSRDYHFRSSMVLGSQFANLSWIPIAKLCSHHNRGVSFKLERTRMICICWWFWYQFQWFRRLGIWQLAQQILSWKWQACDSCVNFVTKTGWLQINELILDIYSKHFDFFVFFSDFTRRLLLWETPINFPLLDPGGVNIIPAKNQEPLPQATLTFICELFISFFSVQWLLAMLGQLY